jgi:hypothetical protein
MEAFSLVVVAGDIFVISSLIFLIAIDKPAPAAAEGPGKPVTPKAASPAVTAPSAAASLATKPATKPANKPASKSGSKGRSKK